MPEPLTLPNARPVVFERSPLSLVVCQLRFEHLGQVERHLEALRERLVDRYPLSQRLQQGEVQVGPGGPQAFTATGLRFASVESDWTLTVMPDFCSLETTKYDDWRDFDARLREALTALLETVHPRVETRLGLRYVNQLHLDAVEKASDWTAYLQPAIVGALAGAAPFAQSTLTAHQLLQLDIGDDARLTFQHGLPGEALVGDNDPLTYLLDFDCFRQKDAPRVLDLDDVLGQADRFNKVITSLFQWCLQETLWKELNPREK
jgi:uncharacterized protein (TIGR04255 family)